MGPASTALQNDTSLAQGYPQVPVSNWGPGVTTANSSEFVRPDCVLCSSPFILDLNEHWKTPCDEAEVFGRKFHGVSADAPLCPHCTQEVRLAGAERMYWKLANF